MKIPKRRFRRSVVVMPLAILPMLASVSPAAAMPEWHGVPQADAGKRALVACVDAARAEGADAWVCVGGDLTTTTRDAGGNMVVNQRTVAHEGLVVDRTPRRSDGPGDAAALSSDYDTWCENGSVCGRLVGTSNQIAEVKGNAAYGTAYGVVGTFDQVLRQNFDGPRPRWRAWIIWDSGPALYSLDWKIHCRVNLTGVDGYCGTHQFVFGTVSSSNWYSYYPSSTGLVYGNRLAGSTRYHDDYYGRFSAAGYSSMSWNTGVLHTGRWQYCASSTGCKYYQVPWAP